MSATCGGSYSTSSGTSAQCMVEADDAPPQRRRMTRREDSRAPAVPEAAWNERRRRDVAKGDGNEKLVHDSGTASGEVVKYSKFGQCCSYDVTRGALEMQTAERDKSDITVTSSGSFPCLHIALSGLKEDLRYYLAIELVEMRSGGGDMFSPMEYSDPYYIPRRNHLKGEQWMKKPRYYNLSAIVNGWLEMYNRRNGSSPMKRKILLRLKSDTTTEREASSKESTPLSPESSETLPDSRRLPTSLEKTTDRSPSPATLPDSQRLATRLEKMAARAPSQAPLPDSWCLPTSTVLPQTPVHVVLTEVAPSWCPRYSSTLQQWLSSTQANQQANAYRQSSASRELCRIFQRAWTVGCPICPTCQASHRNL
ncbi:uncharacterized protein [Dermacentor albipictus]|uniref:uncharacterized protein isoform X6 n=1 Tax=Dermacentor albipictus TaxID=60249 RepID=UPI0031FE1368